MESLCDLFFELSNQDRVRILLQLDKEAMNVTKLSRKLDLTIQEASRHTSRLGEVGLTSRDTDGCHHLSQYGRLVLRQLPGLEFASKYRDYFSSHLHEYLPQELLSRIGELADSIYVDDAVVSMYSIEKMVRKAEEYIWSINFPIPLSVFPLLREAFERGVTCRLMAPKNYIVHPIVRGAVQKEDAQAIYHARATKLLEERFMERMDILLWMSEKEVAIVAFPKPDGNFDSLGFNSTDKRAHKWCRDLFQYHWERANIML